MVPVSTLQEPVTPQPVADFWVLDRGQPENLSTLPLQTNMIGTFVFRTREGAMGLREFLGTDENPESVTIRYKLVKQRNSK